MTHPSGPGVLLDARQAKAVRDALKQSLRAHPDWPDLWNLRGLLDAHDGNLERARSDFEEAIRRHRGYAAACANRAWIDAITGHPTPVGKDGIPAEATAWIGFARNAAAGVDPLPDPWKYEPALDFLALLHAAGKTDGISMQALREQLGRNLPGAERVLEAAGFAESGRLVTRTLRSLSHPERLNPGFAALLLYAARLDGADGRDDDAARLHALAALYEGQFARFLVEQGDAASRRGERERTLALLREAAEVAPDWHRSHQALGYELSVRGIVGESLQHFREATRLTPRFADVLYQYGLLLHAAGLDGEAMDAMGRSLSANPRYLVARIALANLLFEADRAAEAAPHYEHVLDEGIETPALAGQFGYALHRAGDRNRAEELFLDAIARHRSRPELLTHYGKFLMETDRSLEASAVWERALASDPSSRLRTEIESMMDGMATDQRGEAHEG